MVARWRFDDPVDSTSYTFPINPNDGGTPNNEKTITVSPTTAPDGAVVVTEGLDKPQEIEFKGTILFEAQYTAMVEWFNKRHVILLTDDLDRQFRIYITSFVASRKRAQQHPFKHEYSVKATVVP